MKRAEAADVGNLGATTLQREYVFDESDNRVFFDDHVNGVTYHYVYKSALDGDSILRHSDQIEEIQIYDQAAGHRTVGDFVTFETFESDEDGNMTKRILASSGEEISFKWTDFDRLERIESDQEGRMQDARYDVDGLRERKLDKNGNSSVEYGVGITTSASKPASSTSSTPTISYLMGHMLLGAEVDGQFRYHLGDALSSVRDVVDDDGAVIRSFEWDEYGNLLSSSGSGTVSPKTWVGGLSVNDDTADSGMFNMGHRNYAAGVLGRFISRDPIGFAGGLNLYSYPTNPVSFVDPEGLWEFKWSSFGIGVTEGLAGLVVGGAIGFGIALLAPPGVAAALGIAGAAYFIVGFVGNARELCTGQTLDGDTLNEWERSELLGKMLVQGASLGYSKLPHMKVGKENVSGYYAQGPKGRLQYEMRHNTQTKASYERGEPWKPSNWNPANAFSPGMQATGPTPGARTAIEMGRNLTCGTDSVDHTQTLLQMMNRPRNL